jgi:hypothetical protein
MANQIKIRTSVEVVNDNSAGGYTHTALDTNAASRVWGGSYNISTEYTDADVCNWENAVVDITSAGGGLGDSVWNEGNVVPTGTIPDVAHVIAVEYVKELGTVASVSVVVSGEVFALLTPGESVALPFHAGEAVADIEVFASAYSDGVNEATVNVMIAGV